MTRDCEDALSKRARQSWNLYRTWNLFWNQWVTSWSSVDWTMLQLHHFTVCSVCLLYQVCQSDILTSTAHLEDVSKTEENLSTLLERFIKSEKERIDFLKSLLLKRKRFITRIRKFVKSDSMHSLATAAYLWSFTDDWGWILPIVNSSASTLVRKAGMWLSLYQRKHF